MVWNRQKMVHDDSGIRLFVDCKADSVLVQEEKEVMTRWEHRVGRARTPNEPQMME